jgi:cholesterol 7-dehydrogenase
MGANLGHGGKVKYVKCIEYQEYSGNFRCPFHGWTFDGETGKCVNSEHMDSKQVATYEYCDVQKMTSNEKGQYIEKVSEGEIGIDRFHVREMNAFIYIWLHAYLKEP